MKPEKENVNNSYLESITSKKYFTPFNEKDDSNFSQIHESETPLFSKIAGGHLKILMPPGNGLGVIPFQIWWGGMWEVEVSVTNSSGDVLCSAYSNEIYHPSQHVSLMLPVPQPFPAEGTMYTVNCRFKRANYDPSLPWEDAIVGVRGPGPSFAWWYPEQPVKHPEPPADSKDSWPVVAKIGL